MTDADVAGSHELERIPCLDDMCVGILGADGRCGTCGRPGDGTVPAATAEAGDEPDDEPAEARERDDSIWPAGPEPVPDPADRVPCPDDMCVGILGPSGRCGTCGRSAGPG